MAFRPTEVLFSTTGKCNLRCGHCSARVGGRALSARHATAFLASCREVGIRRVGFTGGEPFLALDFMCRVAKEAVRQGFLFDRVMTNGVWWRDKASMAASLERLRDAGYDGSICVSVDAYHGAHAKQIAQFIAAACRVWRRPDVVSVAYVRGGRDRGTKKTMMSLDKQLRGSGAFVRKIPVTLSMAGRSSARASAWDGAWFDEDHCKGPGNVFFVLPNGDVKPCCGYATDRKELTIGNIRRDNAGEIMNNARRNTYVSAVFGRGLRSIRRRLEAAGWKFPGKTSDHCYFCEYILHRVPRQMLARALAAFIAIQLAFSSFAAAQEIRPAKGMKRIPAKVIRRIAIPTWYHEGMFFDGLSLWLANGEKGKIWVVDTASGNVTSEIEPVGDFCEALIRTGDGQLFTTEWYDFKLYRVRLESGRLIAEQDISFSPAHPAGLASDGKRLFVVAWKRGMGTKFDLVELGTDLSVISTMPIRGIHEPDQLAWDGKDLWVSSWYSKRVYRIDTVLWEITGYFESPVSKTTGIAWDGKYMWVTGTYGDLFQMEIGRQEAAR